MEPIAASLGEALQEYSVHADSALKTLLDRIQEHMASIAEEGSGDEDSSSEEEGGAESSTRHLEPVQVATYGRQCFHLAAAAAPSWWARLSVKQHTAFAAHIGTLVFSAALLVWAVAAPDPEEWLEPCEVLLAYRGLAGLVIFCAGALLNCQAFFAIPVM